MAEPATRLPCPFACSCLRHRRIWGRLSMLRRWHLILGLRIEAVPASEFSIEAHGRNADLCGKMPGNLIVDTYTQLLEREGKHVTPLAIRLDNEIPLGMGCGSSAAAVLASVAMAVSLWRARLGRGSDRFRSLSV